MRITFTVTGSPDMPPCLGQTIEKTLVVTDEQQAARAIGQRILKAFNRGQVKMVGGFVHDYQMRFVSDAQGK